MQRHQLAGIMAAAIRRKADVHRHNCLYLVALGLVLTMLQLSQLSV